MSEPLIATFELFLLREPDVDVVEKLQSIAESVFPDVSVVAKTDGDLPDLPIVWVHQTEDWPEPAPVDMLQYVGRGLSEEQAKAVQEPKGFFALTFAIDRDDQWSDQRQACELVQRAVTRFDALVWDIESREMLNADSWLERRVVTWEETVPRISSLISLHVYPNGDLLRFVTIGMAKFGLPDLVANDVPRGHRHAMEMLIVVLTQALAEQGFEGDRTGAITVKLDDIAHAGVRDPLIELAGEKASREALVGLERIESTDGDPEGPLFELAFLGDPRTSPIERRAAVYRDLFGRETEIEDIVHNDALEAESERARTHAIEVMKPFFNAGIDHLERLCVKAPFDTSAGGREWMWVEVTAWSDDSIEGVLLADPRDCEGLRAGARVSVHEDDIFDYYHVKADGSTDGNTTEALLLGMREE